MTARFGRNKRRAALAAVAEANRLATRAKIREASEGHARQRAERFLEEMVLRITLALGADSALLPVEYAKKFRAYGGNRYHPEAPWNLRPLPINLNAMSEPFSELMNTKDLLEIGAVISESPSQLQAYIRLTKLPERDNKPIAGMYLNQETFDRIGLTRHDIDFLVRDVVERLFDRQLRGRR